MDSDKNIHDIEKLLRILGKKIRIDILKKLNSSESFLHYAVLQKEVLALNKNSVNFTYHLKTLENGGLITSSEEGYFITSLGKNILKMISSMEECIDNQHEVKLIRTSKYSKEIFDFKKIEEYLIEEGELNKFLAKKIAKEVKVRLSKTNIQYLTAPLMREFINVILLENGLEEVRHRLTRLGTPPMEVLKLFDSLDSNNVTPDSFIKKLGSDVSEQFLLLNLLPNELADLYLSGEIVLLNLNYWALRPLSIYIDAKQLLDFISKRYEIKCTPVLNSRDLLKFIIHFLELIHNLKLYISEDIVLGNFNTLLSSLFDNQHTDKKSDFLDIFSNQILKFKKYFGENRRNLCLDFSYSENSLKEGVLATWFQNRHNFLSGLSTTLNPDNYFKKPLIMFDYSELKPLSILNSISKRENLSNSLNDIIFYNGKYSNLLNSTLVKVTNFDKYNISNNKIILDKILINLHSIANDANQNDDKFLDILQNRLISVFQFFNHKEQLVQRKLNSLNDWNQIITPLIGKDWWHHMLKSISFFGLNEAVKIHCGIELDRIETSESFALRILSFLNHSIKEKNEAESESFVLTQPHPNFCLNNSWSNNVLEINKSKYYSPRIIRKNSGLAFKKQISLFKKFEEIIEGGSLFTPSVDLSRESLEDNLKILMDSRLSAFTFDNSIC